MYVSTKWRWDIVVRIELGMCWETEMLYCYKIVSEDSSMNWSFFLSDLLKFSWAWLKWNVVEPCFIQFCQLLLVHPYLMESTNTVRAPTMSKRDIVVNQVNSEIWLICLESWLTTVGGDPPQAVCDLSSLSFSPVKTGMIIPLASVRHSHRTRQSKYSIHVSP